MTARQSNATSTRARLHCQEIAGLVALVGLIVLFLRFSWRKWPDPLIDFGTELYTPWRLANGAVLYRDVDCFYGPLSKYFNAALFAILKPGLMVLVTANLIIFAVIVATIYLLCRRAWGALAAFVSSALFIAVFGFSQFVGIGNYNYATPYCHEVTHGLLICLLLAFVLLCWIHKPTAARSFAAGLLLGLAALLKPEILFAAGAVTILAVIERCRSFGRASARAFAMWALGVVLPTAAFASYFATFFPFPQALSFACRGWLAAVQTTRFTGDNIQMGFLGLDQPLKHFEQHALTTFLACVIIALLTCAVWLGEKIRQSWSSILFGAGLAAGTAAFAYFVVNWNEIGRCLLGLVLLYLVLSAPQRNVHVDLARRLIAVLAVAMMLRMILNGRIFQFGFYQAALAAITIPAILIGELPHRLSLQTKGRAFFVIGVCALLLPGTFILARQSIRQLEMKTLAVGQGADRFYVFPEAIEPTGKIVSAISDGLRREASGETLLVLPEGVMINYLARLPSTVAPFIFFSAVTASGGEEEILRELDRHPPDLVVVVSRDLREYGVQRYGEAPGKGTLLLRWVDDNYNQAAHLGGDPLNPCERGAIIFRRR